MAVAVPVEIFPPWVLAAVVLPPDRADNSRLLLMSPLFATFNVVLLPIWVLATLFELAPVPELVADNCCRAWRIRGRLTPALLPRVILPV